MQHQLPPSEYSALVDLYNQTGGPGWTSRNGWINPNATTWYGVTVSGVVYDGSGNVAVQGHVTALVLYANNLTGSIPDSLGNLANLTELRLYANNLSGSIPDTLANLANLKLLYLSNNQLSGIIPTDLGNLSQLQFLELQLNQLNGPIPASLGNLVQLQDLILSGNQLTGSVPPSLGSLSQVRLIVLDNNLLTGGIPASLGSLPLLNKLTLTRNQLTGTIPASLGSLPELKFLYLYRNRLSGNIPASFSTSPKLAQFIVYDNELTGDVPYIALTPEGRILNVRSNYLNVASGSQSMSNILSSGGVGASFIPQKNAPVDLAALSLTWNTTQGGMDFQYAAVVEQPQAIFLYWAAGPSIAYIFRPAIFGQNIPQGSTVPSPVLHVAASAFSSPPSGATHVLLVLDEFNGIPEANETNNIIAVAFLPDLVPAALSWNTAQGGVDFRYSVNNKPLIAATSAKLFWANGTTIANILSSTPIFTQNIPNGSLGNSPVIHVSASAFSSPPSGATHIVMALDYDNQAQETDEANNVLALPLFCAPGEQFVNVLLPEILLDIPIVKVSQLKLRFAPLGLNFTVTQSSEPGVRCEAQSNVGTLTMLVRRLPFIGQIPFVNEDWIIGYSTAQATVTLFQDGWVRWQTPGFDVFPWLDIGPITEWITESDLGFSPLSVPFETTVRVAEDLLHRRLSTKSEILKNLKYIIFEDPGQTDLLVTDPSGAQTGRTVSGSVVTNIPGSAYFASVPLVFALNPAQGTFQTEVRGRISGNYQLITALTDSSRIFFQQSFDGSLDVGQSVVHVTVVPPSLNIVLTGTNVLISWPLPADGFVLESTESLAIPSWVLVPSAITNSVTLPTDSATRFYRLRR